MNTEDKEPLVLGRKNKEEYVKEQQLKLLNYILEKGDILSKTNYDPDNYAWNIVNTLNEEKEKLEKELKP